MNTSAKKNLSEKTAILIATKLTEFFVGLFIPIILARAFTKTDYGYYQQFFVLYNSVEMFLLFYMPFSLFYFYPRLAEGERKTIVFQTTLFLFLSGGIGAGIIGFLTYLTPQFEFFQLSQANLLLRIYTFCTIVSMVLDPYLIVTERHKLLLKILTICAFVKTSGIFLGALGSVSIIVVLQIVTFIAFAKCLLTLLLVYKEWKGETPTMSYALLKEQCIYSFPFGLGTIISTLSILIDRYIIIFFFSPAEFAIYNVGTFRNPVDRIITPAVGNTVLPAISEAAHQGNVSGLLTIWRSAIRKTLLAYIPLCVVLWIGAKDLISFLFTSQYAAATAIFQIYLIIFLKRPLDHGPILKAYGQSRFSLLTIIITLFINIIASLFLVQKIGFIGPAIGTLIASFLRDTLFMIKAKKILSSYWSELLPLKEISSMAMISLGLAVPFISILHNVSEYRTLIFLGLVLVYGVGYFYAMLFFKGTTKQEVGHMINTIIGLIR